VNDAVANRLTERRWLLIWWVATVITITMLGVGFAGGVKQAFSGNVIAWLFVASPAIPLAMWLRARSRYRVGL